MKKSMLLLFFFLFLAKNKATAQGRDSIFIPKLVQRSFDFVGSEEIPFLPTRGCPDNKTCVCCRVVLKRFEYNYFCFDCKVIDYSHRFDLIDFGTEAEYEQMLNQVGFLPVKKQKWYKETL